MFPIPFWFYILIYKFWNLLYINQLLKVKTIFNKKKPLGLNINFHSLYIHLHMFNISYYQWSHRILLNKWLWTFSELINGLLGFFLTQSCFCVGMCVSVLVQGLQLKTNTTKYPHIHPRHSHNQITAYTYPRRENSPQFVHCSSIFNYIHLLCRHCCTDLFVLIVLLSHNTLLIN